jgi:hypothetical protein
VVVVPASAEHRQAFGAGGVSRRGTEPSPVLPLLVRRECDLFFYWVQDHNWHFYRGTRSLCHRSRPFEQCPFTPPGMHLFLEREIPFVSYNTSQPENLAYAICNGCAIKNLKRPPQTPRVSSCELRRCFLYVLPAPASFTWYVTVQANVHWNHFFLSSIFLSQWIYKFQLLPLQLL